MRVGAKGMVWGSLISFFHVTPPLTNLCLFFFHFSISCRLRDCRPRIPYRRSSRTSRQRSQGSESETNHPASLTTGYPRRRRTGHADPRDDRLWRCSTAHQPCTATQSGTEKERQDGCLSRRVGDREEAEEGRCCGEVFVVGGGMEMFGKKKRKGGADYWLRKICLSTRKNFSSKLETSIMSYQVPDWEREREAGGRKQGLKGL